MAVALRVTTHGSDTGHCARIPAHDTRRCRHDGLTGARAEGVMIIISIAITIISNGIIIATLAEANALWAKDPANEMNVSVTGLERP